MIDSFKLDNLRFIILKRELFEKTDAEEFIRLLFINMGYNVKKMVGVLGHPDFLVTKDNEEFYLEVKTKSHSIQPVQIEWIKNHPDKIVYVLFYIQQEQKQKLARMQKKEEQKKEDFDKFCIEAREVLKKI